MDEIQTQEPEADINAQAAEGGARPANNTEKPEPKPWRHPQAWVPRDISFIFFIAPFFFWPLVVALGILHVYSQDMSDVSLDELRNFNPPTVSYVYAEDGAVTLAELYREHRLLLPLEQIPPLVIKAFLAAEDSNFFQHQGVDFMGLVRAAIANFRAGHTVQGASTITQQMVRTFLLSNERTYDRKLREIVLSWRVERTMTKDDILYLYLNRIYLGRGAYGVESAARLYFGKGIREVNLAEAAMLAGLVKAPGRMAAHLGSEMSRERQAYVLNRMREVGFISEYEYRNAVNRPLNFIQFRPNYYRETAPQFTEIVRRQAIELLGEDELLTGGYKIYTTIDLKAQEMARGALRNGLDALAKRQRMSPRVSRMNQVQALEYNRRQRETLKDRPLQPGQEIAALVTDMDLSKENPGLFLSLGSELGFIPHEELKWLLRGQKLDQYFALDDLIMVRALEKDEEAGHWKLTAAPPPDLQGGLVLLENKTGAVKAIIGGRDFGQSQFNRAVQARRQPGSSFKPFVYAAALDNGYTEASVIYDVPTSYPQSGGRVWQPKNYSGKFSGPMTLYDALRTSTNVVAVKVGEAVGPEIVAAYAKKMGIASPLYPTLSLSLGASEVTLLEITQAYTTFPNLGSWCWPIFIERVLDREGQVVRRFDPTLTPAISPQTAYIMVDMLVGVATRGTAARVGQALKIPIGGKTGTTNDQADALFIGFTPEYTCGVWVGRDLRISLGPGEQGGRSASPIFIEFMQNFLADKETGKFTVPEGVVRQSLGEAEYDDMGVPKASQSFVFKVDEVGRGRVDEKAAAEEAAAAGPLDFSTMSQEELDRRLLEYLQDYERRRAAGQ